eukprot:5227075-Alexandrium_andersonii.AAC.1
MRGEAARTGAHAPCARSPRSLHHCRQGPLRLAEPGCHEGLRGSRNLEDALQRQSCRADPVE